MRHPIDRLTPEERVTRVDEVDTANAMNTKAAALALAVKGFCRDVDDWDWADDGQGGRGLWLAARCEALEGLAEELLTLAPRTGG